ncbi:2-oxo acid dehydrogenase subunit E2 [bacterium]|nr:2-oxo acid dehydrogenase subunit E2 [bacterium]
MPKQGQSVESCILTDWYKNVGDKVNEGELLFAFETDKAAFEEEATSEGILLAQFYEAGDEVPVLSTLGVIGSKGESVEEFIQGGVREAVSKPTGIMVKKTTGSIIKNSKDSTMFKPGIQQGGTADGYILQGNNGKVNISPRARNLAKKKRILLNGILGTGPQGRIIERNIIDEIKKGKRLTPLAKNRVELDGLVLPDKGKTPYGKITTKDLEDALVISREIHSEKYSDIKQSNVRKIIANTMYRSLQNSAQLTHHLSAKASKMLQIRKEVKSRLNDGYEYNITLNDMVCYSVVRALKQFPYANAHYLSDKIRVFNKVNLGVAVDTERGLMVPTLLDADDLSLPGLSMRLKNLVDSSKSGNISPDLILPETASFTISNLGNYGVEFFTPIINLPQVAILGVNTIIKRPAEMEDGTLGFLPFIGLSLTYDHRALDGGPATLFLREIKNEIEKLSIDLL